MHIYEFSTDHPFIYHICGKFTSPTPKWIHLTRNLVDFELIIVTEGTLYIADHRREYRVDRGHYLLMQPTPNQHGTRSCDCSFYWVHFSCSPKQTFRCLPESEADASYAEGRLPIPFSDQLSSMERALILFNQLQDADRRYHESNYNNYLCSALICELHTQGRIFTAYQSDRRHRQHYEDILNYISYHICEDLRVDQLAAHFGYSAKYFTTFFRRMSGVPLKQYLLQAKIDFAKGQLADTNHSVSQIAYDVGYKDPHNFSRTFKRLTGLSPSEYREQYLNRILHFE